MKRYLKWLVLLLAVVILSVLTLTLGSGNTSKNRAIAHDLLRLQRQWDTRDDKLSLLQSLTNLPFNAGAATDDRAFVYRRKTLIGMRLEEAYFIDKSTSNVSEWILYHGWYWENWEHRHITVQKLLTIVETNTARSNP